MATPSSRSGRGSNQYRRRGHPSALTAGQLRGVRNQVASEAAAWAFHVDPDSVDTRAVKRLTRWEGQSRWAAHPSPGVRARVAASPRATIETLTVLSEDPAAEVQAAVAGNSECPPPVMERMIRSSDSAVARAALHNSSVTDDRLRVAADEDPDRFAVFAAGNPNITNATASWLYRRCDDRCARGTDMDTALARNPSSPPAILVEIAAAYRNDPHYFFVASEAIMNGAYPSEMLQQWSDLDTAPGSGNSIVMGAVTRDDCPPDAVSAFARSADGVVRAAAARHPNLPASLYFAMLMDSHTAVRMSFLRNPSCPLDEIAAAFTDPAKTVQEEARRVHARRLAAR